MLYQKIYDQIIEKAKTRMISEYSEKHHIVPRCLGGSDDKDNLVRLTFREHFLCHWMLCKIHPDNQKLIHAFSRMVHFSPKNSDRFLLLTSRHFETVKRYYRPIVGQWNKGKTPWNKGLYGDKYKARYKNGGLTPPRHDGARWINNGIETKKIKCGVLLPEGYVYGRLSMIGNNNPMKNGITAKKNGELRKKNEI